MPDWLKPLIPYLAPVGAAGVAVAVWAIKRAKRRTAAADLREAAKRREEAEKTPTKADDEAAQAEFDAAKRALEEE